MTALLAGIDWSSKAIHAALVPLDEDHGDPSCPPVVFRQERLPERGGDPTIRIRAVREIVRSLLVSIVVPAAPTWHNTVPQGYPFAGLVVDNDRSHDVASVWIEEAWGNHRNTDRALLPIYGAIIASVRADVVVAGISAAEWRKELKLPGHFVKMDAVVTALRWIDEHRAPYPVVPDEHQAEALLVALAGRRIMQRHSGVAA